MSKESFGLGYHRLSKTTKWRRCHNSQKQPTSWLSDSSSDDNSSPQGLAKSPSSIVIPQIDPEEHHANLLSEVHPLLPHSSPTSSSCESEVPNYVSDDTNSGVDSSPTEEVDPPSTSSNFASHSIDSSNSSMIEFLQKWAVDYNVTHSSMDALLKGLKSHACFMDLPSCGRTVLNTPTKLVKYELDPGYYVHLGLEDQLITLLTNLAENVNKVELLVNVDGLPPFKSFQGELYPILVSVLNIKKLRGKVITVGIYYGAEKPRSIQLFLMPFVNEINKLLNEGVDIENAHIEISLAGFCCDAPAKSYIMGVIGHGGFYSCTRCTLKGTTVEKRRVFLESDCPRTHEDFKNKTDKHYCSKDTPLSLIPSINFVNSFVLDYMHLVCLGVVRTLLVTWTSGTKSLKSSRLSRSNRCTLSGNLDLLASAFRSEFARKLRNLTVLLRWKATEFRMFLIYAGPVVLKGVLNDERYTNFLELHIAMTILLSPNICKDEEARYNSRKLLVHFVKMVAYLYGVQLITHNFHGLFHLVDDADNFVGIIEGFTLNDISAFQFENHLQTLKKFIRGKNKPLEQTSKRLAEKFALQCENVRENNCINNLSIF
ncbi:uncharacterized protein LOC120351604 [Nilaparvata lugens]|uniref:uncharacterized protein LOC120351604 n=1 Tax=Nilaparvata lugens TaxID=108931 RepID=UPI00193E119A|nr:uncharacterized protein LOC120351604 [Nilaparvata lugens]